MSDLLTDEAVAATTAPTIRRQNRNEWMAEQIEREFGAKP